MAFQIQKPNIPSKYRPRGFHIIHEDRDLIIIEKQTGKLSVAALWNKDSTVHSDLNTYVRKGNPKASQITYVVHRLDQATSGLMVFTKNESAQKFLKDNWQKMKKTYLTITDGHFKNKSGVIESYLEEDEDYHMHSSQDQTKGKLAITEYQVLKESDRFSLVKINLRTGKKNQIRVHMANECNNPIVGDLKYGKKSSSIKELMLHAYHLQLIHPFSKEVFSIETKIPERFQKLFDCQGLNLISD